MSRLKKPDFIMSGEGFLERILDIVSRRERIMVVGRMDTGKSTLIKNLADHIDAYVLDGDIGQNDVGPPSVISLGKRVDGQYRAIDGYFCGSTTPSRHFLQMIAGVSRLIQSCRGHRVLINTTGLATGAIGMALKTEKINAVRPDLIIGLEVTDELKYLYAFARAGSEVVTFRPHPMVTSRSRAERALAREAAFRTHFEGAVSTVHRIDGMGVERLLLNNGNMADADALQAMDPDIVYAETLGREALIVSRCSIARPGEIARYLQVDILYAFRPSDFTGALTGLLDDHGHLLALGIIESVDFRSGTITVFSTADRFSVMQFGSMKLDKTDFTYAGAFGPETLRP
jgi:polynucleotide 5'-hydroxyl-kinase GRC3/NOL9